MQRSKTVDHPLTISYKIAFKLIERLSSFKEALKYYVSKNISIIDSTFMFEMIARYRSELKNSEEGDQLVKSFLEENLSKLIFIDSSRTYFLIKSTQDFKFEISNIHMLE